MRILGSFILVGVLALGAFVGAEAGGQTLLGIGLPYLAVAVFLWNPGGHPPEVLDESQA